MAKAKNLTFYLVMKPLLFCCVRFPHLIYIPGHGIQKTIGNRKVWCVVSEGGRETDGERQHETQTETRSLATFPCFSCIPWDETRQEASEEVPGNIVVLSQPLIKIHTTNGLQDKGCTRLASRADQFLCNFCLCSKHCWRSRRSKNLLKSQQPNTCNV